MPRGLRTALRLSLVALTFAFNVTRVEASPPTMLQGVLGLTRCPALSLANAPQSGALESIWHLDEPSFSSSLSDATPTARSLTALSSFSSVAKAKVRSGAQSINNDFGLSTTKTVTDPQTFTIAAWVKVTGSNGGIITHFAQSQSGSSSGRDRYFGVDQNGQIAFGIYTGSIVIIRTPLSYNDGNWHHVAVRYAANVATLFVDGVNVLSQNVGAAQAYTGYWRLAGGDYASWGALNFSTTALNGGLDELVIFNTGLSDLEIDALSKSLTELNSSYSHWAQTYGVWHFNESSGLYQDSSANVNHVIAGQANPISGFFGNGYLGPAPLFLATAASIASPDVMSIAMWFRSTASGLMSQYANAKNAQASSYDRQLALQTDGSVYFGTFGGSSQFTVTTSNPGFNDGQWHHVVATYQLGAQALYVDGVQVATGSPPMAQSFTGYWLFGNGNYGGWTINVSTFKFVGELDEIGFWRAILTPSEVLALYNKQKVCP